MLNSTLRQDCLRNPDIYKGKKYMEKKLDVAEFWANVPFSILALKITPFSSPLFPHPLNSPRSPTDPAHGRSSVLVLAMLLSM